MTNHRETFVDLEALLPLPSLACTAMEKLHLVYYVSTGRIGSVHIDRLKNFDYSIALVQNLRYQVGVFVAMWHQCQRAEQVVREARSSDYIFTSVPPAPCEFPRIEFRSVNFQP